MEALYDFDATETGELSMKKGDRLTIVNRTDQNWWTGKHTKTGKIGLIPKPYVKVLEI